MTAPLDPETQSPNNWRVDVHGGLRVWLQYDPSDRAIKARFSAEAGTVIVVDVERAIASAKQRAGYLETWLGAYRRDYEPTD